MPIIAQFIHASADPCQDLKIGLIFRAYVSFLAESWRAPPLTRHRAQGENCAKKEPWERKCHISEFTRVFWRKLNTQSTMGVSFWILPCVLLDTVASSDKLG